MWPFSRKPNSERLKDHKTVKISGMRFIIKPINPLFDFPDDNIPSIFTDKREIPGTVVPPPEESADDRIKKLMDGMGVIVAAGLIEPKVRNADGGEGGVTIEELFSQPLIGIRLFLEIMKHSTKALRYDQKVFFWIAGKLLLSTFWLRGTGKRRQRYFSKAKNHQ